MGKYSVPESIRKLKPKGTMVKAISGHYYMSILTIQVKMGNAILKWESLSVQSGRG